MEIIEEIKPKDSKIKIHFKSSDKKYKRIVIKNEEEEEEEEEEDHSSYYSEHKIGLFNQGKTVNLPKGKGCVWTFIFILLLSILLLIITGQI
jgi:hypothetical protein